MLVLSRKVGELIYIGDDITVKVNDIKGDRVSLAITAPRHLSIDRQEIRTRKTREANRDETLTNKPLNMEGFACGYCGNSPCSCPPAVSGLGVG